MNKFIICFLDNKWYSLDTKNNIFDENLFVNVNDTYITFQVPDFIRLLKASHYKNVPTIVNLESLYKQFKQSGKDILGDSKWHIMDVLKNEKIIENDYKINEVKDFLSKLIKFYAKVVLVPEERRRFDRIELKVNKIIYETQLRGINVDESNLNFMCDKLHHDIYSIKNELQIQNNIFQPHISKCQIAYLKSKGYRILVSHKKTISWLRETDNVCELFYKLNKATLNLKSLLFSKAQYGGGSLIHPNFIGFGTITGRIIVKEPSIQNLSKDYRKIIIPSEGKILFYIDYSQFEAGILAHFSNDQKLLDLFNNYDIYNDIAEKVLNLSVSNDNRKKAKILFYRFLYGDDFIDNKIDKKKIDQYFNSFKDLMKFKAKLINKSESNGIVESVNGNFRKLNIEVENIWILSHHIQSIGSLIFKKALINCYENLKGATLLIPMHDGALYEVDLENQELIQKEIEEIYLDTVKSECKKLYNIKVETKNGF